MMSKRAIIVIVVVAIAVLVAVVITLSVVLTKKAEDSNPAEESKEEKEKPPHIVFILADDYGYNDVGYHGSEISTPNIDSLALSGVRLENYYVQPICTPTRSQLMSGRYQIHTGLQHASIKAGQRNGLPLDCVTLAQRLSSAGYATHMVGKWHLGFFKKEYMPHNRGFDSFFGYLNGGQDYFTHQSCIRTGGSRDCGLDFRENDDAVRKYENVYSTNVFTDKAIERIENHDTSKPLFLYLAHQAPHPPLQVPEHYTQAYSNITDPKRRTYAGMVSAMDESVGNVTRALKDAGMYDNTIIIFSTDNGGQTRQGASNYPLQGGKGSFWEGGVRGVGFVHSPLLDLSLQGLINRDLLHVSDWYPTLTQLAGGDLAEYLVDGYDVWESITNKTKSPRKELLHNIDLMFTPSGEERVDAPFDVRIRAAIRSGPWKLLTGDPGGGHQNQTAQNVYLFNVEEDPRELKEVSSENPDVVDQLLERLAFYNSSSIPVRYPEVDVMAYPGNYGGFWQPWVDLH